jgi:hypothetical protein
LKFRLSVAVLTAVVAFSVMTPANAYGREHSLKTGWGYISVPIVKAPKQGRCVDVSAKVDVRNAAKVPRGGINIGIIDDFDNVIAYSEWSNFPEVKGKLDTTRTKPNGVYIQRMTACAKPSTWTDPYQAGRTLQLTAVTGNFYTFTAISKLDRIPQGESIYIFQMFPRSAHAALKSAGSVSGGE